MTEPREPQKKHAAFAAALMGCAVAFAGFVGAWWTLIGTVQDSDDYAVAVARSVAGGDVTRALRVAQLASEQHPIDTEAVNLYAKTLLHAGRTDDALRQYRHLFGIRVQRNPAYDPNRPSGLPTTVSTMRPFFFPDARLELAKYYAEQGDDLRAAANIELARAFGQAIPEDDHAFLYAQYGALGAWGRAFEYGLPNAEALAEMGGDALLTLARYAAAHALWSDCEAAAEVLLAKGVNAEEATLWMGCALLALGRVAPAADAFEAAMDSGDPDAPFWLGLTREVLGVTENQAELFLRTTPDSLYYAFSLAKAAQCLEQEAASNGTDALEQAARIRGEISAYFEESFPLPRPFMPEDMAIRPLGFAFEKGRPAFDGPFLVLTLWEDTRHSQNVAEDTLVFEGLGHGRLAMRLGRHVVDLRLATNLVPFGSFDGLPAGCRDVPGWPEVYRQPQGAEGLGYLEIATADEATVLRARCDDPAGVTGTRTAPMPVTRGRYYLLAVRCRSHEANLYAGWDWFDAAETVVYNHNVFNQVEIPEMEWRTEYVRRPNGAAYVQALVGIFRDTGLAEFDAVLVAPLDPPKDL